MKTHLKKAFHLQMYRLKTWQITIPLVLAIVDIVSSRTTNSKNTKASSSSSPVLEIRPDERIIEGPNTIKQFHSKLQTLNTTHKIRIPSTHSGPAHLRRKTRSLAATSVRMPGTNWCGKGWRAERFEHLGTYGPTDKCCRQHDLGCPAAIQPGETVLGLENTLYFTMMHCKCDERFRSCLKMVGSSAANTVGSLFFNVLETPCFVLGTEKVCMEYTWWGKCVKEETRRIAVRRDPVSF